MRFCDPVDGYLEQRAELDAAWRRVMLSGRYVLGAELEAFEREFAKYCGVAHCVGVGNGLDALTLILRGLGVKAGDEVIVPSNTYIATWLAVSAVGARPVPVEPDEASFNIDPNRIEAAITERTQAVLATALYGQEIPDLAWLAKARDLWIVADCAQAHGAEPIVHASGYSFYPTKNLGCYGDGGAVTTPDKRLAERIRYLRNYGSAVKYRNEERGLNSRLDELQAALLRVKLRQLDMDNERRRVIARRYLQNLPQTELQLPYPVPDTRHVWHQFVVRTARRDELQRALAVLGVETLVHYPVPPHLQPAYADLGFKRGDFPIAERLADEALSLPIWPQMTRVQVENTCDAVHEALRGMSAP